MVRKLDEKKQEGEKAFFKKAILPVDIVWKELSYMEIAISLVCNTAIALISVLELAMMVRAILSWFDPTGEGSVSAFLYAVTEPIIFPIRRLCEKMHWFEGLPLDIPFLLTYLVLIVLQVFLEML